MQTYSTEHRRAIRLPWCLAGLLLLLTASPPLAAEPPAQLRPWLEYRAIMWIGDTAHQKPEKFPLFCRRLREMGINTAMVYSEGNPQPLLDNHFPYYVENLINRGLCLKFNSKAADWDKLVTDWARAGRPESALVRDYCLDDPQWGKWAREEMQKIVRQNMTHGPVAYDIRDELSTTISANPFDYDLGPVALSHFREWLKTEYSNLAALNAEWETRFGSWDEVKPFTTDQIKNRMATGDALPRGTPDWQAVQTLKFDPVTARQSPTRWNFSPWADFRSYMDLSLARTLNGLRQAAHELDPRTPVGIEGTQMPHAFGGYDLWRLSQALDWVEPYDVGNAREILGSFMPGKPLMTTVFESDTDHASRRLWHLLLQGDRGCIIWWSEDCIDWKSADYQLTPKARALAPVLKEMTSPLAQLFLRAQRERDPIFVHYSQPSIQVDWLLESTVDGSTWLRRFSSFEADHNRQAKVRNSWLKVFQDLGYTPRFISSEQIEAGDLDQAGRTVLVLPSSWALSDKEILAIRRSLDSPRERGTTAFWDGTPGLFDQHGKLRLNDPLSADKEARADRLLSCTALTKAGASNAPLVDVARYAVDRLKGGAAQPWSDWVATQLESMRPEITVPAGACVRIHRFRAGTHRLVAFERNINYQMSEELKQAGGNEALEKPVELDAGLKAPVHVYDLRAQGYVGYTDRIHFTLDPWHPSVFALTSTKLPAEGIVGALLEGVSGTESHE